MIVRFLRFLERELVFRKTRELESDIDVTVKTAQAFLPRVSE